MVILGIETSCDDTSMALYSRTRGVISEFTSSQFVHERYGGVVPEIASRAHIRTILGVFEKVMAGASLDHSGLTGIGVSNGPGLIGSLLVGVGFAKALAYGLGIPLVGVHHLEGHIFANELGGEELEFPCVVLVASGGHTALYHVEEVGKYSRIGSTRDDAAGEAFDKIAKLLGLGYPGGPAIEEAARSGDPGAVAFPRAMMTSGNYDFSFSGLKTAVRLHVEESGRLDDGARADIAASAQEAIADVLAEKTLSCARQLGVCHMYLAGGVAANSRLRWKLVEGAKPLGLTFHAPAVSYCTDNGAMIGCAAFHRISRGLDDGPSLDVFARGALTSWA